MTKHDLFIKAHTLARNTVKAVGDYAIAFKLALKALYTNPKTSLKPKFGNTAKTAKSVKTKKVSLNTSVEASQYLLKHFKNEGINTRRIGVMSMNKTTVRIRIKDATIATSYVEKAVAFVKAHATFELKINVLRVE